MKGATSVLLGVKGLTEAYQSINKLEILIAVSTQPYQSTVIIWIYCFGVNYRLKNKVIPINKTMLWLSFFVSKSITQSLDENSVWRKRNGTSVASCRFSLVQYQVYIISSGIVKSTLKHYICIGMTAEVSLLLL